MKDVKTDRIKLWKLAIREVYNLDLITEQDFISMYNYTNDEFNNSDKEIVDLTYDTIKNTKLMADMLHEEINVIAKGIIPDDKRLFKKMWLSYLMDCLDSDLITKDDFDGMRNYINFDNDIWTDEEMESAINIVDMVRFILVKKRPTAIGYIDNPSFDLLMYANNLDYV